MGGRQQLAWRLLAHDIAPPAAVLQQEGRVRHAAPELRDPERRPEPLDLPRCMKPASRSSGKRCWSSTGAARAVVVTAGSAAAVPADAWADIGGMAPSRPARLARISHAIVMMPTWSPAAGRSDRMASARAGSREEDCHMFDNKDIFLFIYLTYFNLVIAWRQKERSGIRRLLRFPLRRERRLGSGQERCVLRLARAIRRAHRADADTRLRWHRRPRPGYARIRVRRSGKPGVGANAAIRNVRRVQRGGGKNETNWNETGLRKRHAEDGQTQLQRGGLARKTISPLPLPGEAGRGPAAVQRGRALPS